MVKRALAVAALALLCACNPDTVVHKVGWFATMRHQRNIKPYARPIPPVAGAIPVSGGELPLTVLRHAPEAYLTVLTAGVCDVVRAEPFVQTGSSGSKSRSVIKRSKLLRSLIASASLRADSFLSNGGASVVPGRSADAPRKTLRHSDARSPAVCKG